MSQRHISLLNQLLENPEFIQWAKGEKPMDDDRWMDWAGRDTERREILEQARQLVVSVNRESDVMSDVHIQKEIRQALDIARKSERENTARKVSRIISFRNFKWTAAASVLVILGIGVVLTRIYRTSTTQNTISKQKESTESPLFAEVTNLNRALKYVQLPDGSSVVLHKNSTLRYPKEFQASKREVTLSGEAFFEVTKNPAQPFFVYANELVAKVHGTSFSVKAGIRDDRVIVAVKTGKVSVFARKNGDAGLNESGNEASAMLLTRNQQATFERNRAKLVRSAIRTSSLLNIPIESQMFTFEETPVDEVFDMLGGAYGVDIVFNKEEMSNCSITATLGDEPLENKLKWICAILEAEYEISKEKISIKGNSCR